MIRNSKPIVISATKRRLKVDISSEPKCHSILLVSASVSGDPKRVVSASVSAAWKFEPKLLNSGMPKPKWIRLVSAGVSTRLKCEISAAVSAPLI